LHSFCLEAKKRRSILPKIPQVWNYAAAWVEDTFSKKCLKRVSIRNYFKTSGSWSCELPLQLMAIWLSYGKFHGKGWQRPQSRHCGNATHLLDACCSSLCYELLKLPDQCTPSKPRNRSRGALLSSRALLRDTQLSRRKNDEKRCEEPLHHAPSHGVSGIRRCAHHNADKCCILLRTLS
jgi:hypothetical protein